MTHCGPRWWRCGTGLRDLGRGLGCTEAKLVAIVPPEGLGVWGPDADDAGDVGFGDAIGSHRLDLPAAALAGTLGPPMD